MTISTIPEQVTLILNKDIALMLAKFLETHIFEWRRFYDTEKGIMPHPLDPDFFKYKPSLDSREVWDELIKALTPKTP